MRYAQWYQMVAARAARAQKKNNSVFTKPKNICTDLAFNR